MFQATIVHGDYNVLESCLEGWPKLLRWRCFWLWNSICELMATGWETHSLVITFIKPVNLWSHPVSCNGPLRTYFQSYTLYRFFVSVPRENNSHEAFWEHTQKTIYHQKNFKAWSSHLNKKYWKSRKTSVITSESGMALLHLVYSICWVYHTDPY